MKEHEHATQNRPETMPAHDEVAKKAYAIYLKEGRPQGRDVQNWLEAETKMPQAAPDHHAHMAADFRKRFWISLVLTLPILVLSPMLQTLVGLREAIRFPGDLYVLFGLSSAVFWYGGWPFLKGFFEELKSRRPGMMTLICRGTRIKVSDTNNQERNKTMQGKFVMEIRTLLLPAILSLAFVLASCGGNNNRDERQTADTISQKQNAAIVAGKQQNAQPDMHAWHGSLANNFAHKDIVILDAPYQLSEPARVDMGQVIHAYLLMKDALVKGDVSAADESVDLLSEKVAAVIPTRLKAEGLAAWQNHQKLYETTLKEMRNSKGLENKRSYFSHISEIMYCTIKSFGLTNGEMFAVFCPMAFNGKGAYWISGSKEIQNPYFGKKMLKCGEVKEIL